MWNSCWAFDWVTTGNLRGDFLFQSLWASFSSIRHSICKSSNWVITSTPRNWSVSLNILNTLWTCWNFYVIYSCRMAFIHIGVDSNPHLGGLRHPHSKARNDFTWGNNCSVWKSVQLDSFFVVISSVSRVVSCLHKAGDQKIRKHGPPGSGSKKKHPILD